MDDVIGRTGQRYHRALVTSLRPAIDPVTSAPRWRVALAVMVVLVLGNLVVLAGQAAGTPLQDPTVTSAPQTGLDPVPEGDDPPEVADEPAPGADQGAEASSVSDENRRIWLVVGGLVVVALALTLLTIRYWRHTRPTAVVADEAAPVSTGRERRGPRSPRVVAGADHATADESWEPRGTGEYDSTTSPPTRRQSRPTRAQRASAYRAGGR